MTNENVYLVECQIIVSSIFENVDNITAMICLVYFKTDGWPWIHLDEAGSSGSEVVAGRYTGLSLRCGAWGFPVAAMRATPSYFQRKIEEK